MAAERTRLDIPPASPEATLAYVAGTLRALRLTDLADTIEEGHLENALIQCQRLGLGFQADALAGVLRALLRP